MEIQIMKKNQLSIAARLLIVVFLLIFLSSQSWAYLFPGGSEAGSGKNIDIENGLSSASVGVDTFTGAAQISYALSVPPGRRNVNPQLGLLYNSQGGNGWIGVGWHLDMGYIVRDTSSGIPSYDDDQDKFIMLLNGRSCDLLLISGASGSKQTYQCEVNEFFYRITYENRTWTVEDTGGRTYRFGQTAGSRVESYVVFKWCLDRIEDVYGNYMDITYTERGNQIYLQSIKYTGNSETDHAPDREVTFILEGRPDIKKSFKSGFEITTDRRLSRVNMSVDGNILTSYNFEYEDPNDNQKISSSRLVKITQTGLPPTTFTYTTPDGGFDNFDEWSTSWSYEPIRFSYDDRYSPDAYETVYETFDIDGNALPDKVYSNPSLEYWAVRYNWGNAFSSSAYAWDKLDPYVMDAFRTTYDGGTTDRDIFDIDGDGLVDFVYGIYEGKFNVYLNNGYGFDGPTSWQSPTPTGETTSLIRRTKHPGKTTVETRDINGDGLPDRIVLRGDCNFNVYLNNGKKDGLDGFDDPVLWENHTCGWSFDIDGNDLLDNIMKDLNTDESNIISDLIDMNGDGLVDRVTWHSNHEDFRVYWNQGDGFKITYDVWNDPVNRGSIRKFVNDDVITQSVATIEDINGDGLPDRIVSGEMGNANPLRVYLNTGSGFNSTPIYWTNPSDRPIHVNSLSGYNWFGQGEVQGDFQDMNGDGLNDIIWTGVTSNAGAIYDTPAPGDGWAVYYNSGPVPDLLTSVENGIGGRTEINYAPSIEAYDTHYLPYIFQTVSSVMKDPGIEGSTPRATLYWYGSGSFDQEERVFSGFGTATQIEAKLSGGELIPDPDGKTTTSHFLNGDQKLRGRLWATTIDETDSNKTLSETFTPWNTKELTIGVFFPYQEQMFTNTWESVKRSTKTEYVYDVNVLNSPPYNTAPYNPDEDFGKVIVINKQGDFDIEGDEITEYLDFAYRSEPYLVAPYHHKIVGYRGDETNVTLSEKWIYYDNIYTQGVIGNKGNPTRVEKWLDTGSGENPVVYMSYDDYGNLETTTGTEGMVHAITYDTQDHIFPELVCDAVGTPLEVCTQKEFDNTWGKVMSVTKAYGTSSAATTRYRYDSLGRLTASISPADSQTYPTMTISYFLNATPPSYIVVKNRENHGQPSTSDEYFYFDGFGRNIQSRSEAGDDNWLVVDGGVLNGRGLVVERVLPYFAYSSLYSAPAGPPSQVKDRYEYDHLGRTTKVTSPNQNSIFNIYDTSDQGWTTTAFDPEGKESTTLSNAYGQVIEKSGDSYPTQYQYDAAGHLISTKLLGDTDTITTTLGFDSLGRKISMDDPDSGVWNYRYDLAGNMISQKAPDGVEIRMFYDDLNRLTLKDFAPLNRLTSTTQTAGSEDVVYVYDDPDVSYSKGMITSVEFPLEDGIRSSISYAYNNMTSIVATTYDLDISSFGQEYVFGAVQDARGNLKILTYPDNTSVEYSYNSGGLLESVEYEGTVLADYSDFAPNGSPTSIVYANGVETNYAFYDGADSNNDNAYTHRLKSIVTERGSTTLQDFIYNYTPTGLVDRITDLVNTGSLDFEYDNQYRLTRADGYNLDGTAFQETYGYDDIGNMTFKAGQAFEYSDPVRPHQIQNAGFSYDANGNLTANTKGADQFVFQYKPGTSRLQSVDKNGSLALQFAYDDQGQRLKKSSPAGDYTYFLSQYLEFGGKMESGSLVPFIRKHIFAGGTRIATISPPQGAQCLGDIAGGGYFTGPDGVVDSADFARAYKIYMELITPVESDKNGDVGPATPGECNDGTIIPKATQTDYPDFLDAGIILNHAAGLIRIPCAPCSGSGAAMTSLDTGTFLNTSFLSFSLPYEDFLRLYVLLFILGSLLLIMVGTRRGWWHGGEVFRTVGIFVLIFAFLCALQPSSLLFRSLSKEVHNPPIACAAMSDDEVIHYYHHDHLGSVNVVTDGVGNQVDLLEYHPFGEMKGEDSWVTDQTFTDHQWDSEIGIYYFGSRYYDPDLGVFLTLDPQNQFPSPYLYGGGNPVNGVDPDGEWFGGFMAYVGISALASALWNANMASSLGYDPSKSEFWEIVGRGALSGAVSAAGGYLANDAGALVENAIYWSGVDSLVGQWIAGAGNMIGHYGLYAAAGATNAAINGGSVRMGAAMGAATAIGEDLGEKLLGGLADGKLGRLLKTLGRLSGGTAAEYGVRSAFNQERSDAFHDSYFAIDFGLQAALAFFDWAVNETSYGRTWTHLSPRGSSFRAWSKVVTYQIFRTFVSRGLTLWAMSMTFETIRAPDQHQHRYIHYNEWGVLLDKPIHYVHTIKGESIGFNEYLERYYFQ